MVYRPSDLSTVERALLGAMSIGLPPSKAAGDDTFRLDHVTAVVVAMLEGAVPTDYLDPDAVQVSAGFRATLRAAIERLTACGILADQPAGVPSAAGGFEAGLEIDLVNPDEHPALLDRQLGQECMERLFDVPAVSSYLLDRYARSGEVWRRLRDDGYLRD